MSHLCAEFICMALVNSGLDTSGSLCHVPQRNVALVQVGAEVIPADRDARITIQRYLWKTRYLTYKNAGKMHRQGVPVQIGDNPTMLTRGLAT